MGIHTIVFWLLSLFGEVYNLIQFFDEVLQLRPLFFEKSPQKEYLRDAFFEFWEILYT